MNYDQAIEEINSLLVFGIKPGLERIKKLLSLMGNPQDDLHFVHVAGTNGKGSTCTMLSYILEQAGYKTGLFTSPYIIDFRERFQINNSMIDKCEVAELTEHIMPLIEEMAKNGEIITEFEFITAMAFKWFADKECDIVVLETGMGGRFDATNVITNPLVSIITSISLDHTKILGDTLSKIAYEKAGIIKNNSLTVLSSTQEKEVIDVISSVSNKKNSELIISNFNELSIVSSSLNGSEALYKGNKYDLPLIGTHQLDNLSLVLTSIELLNKSGYTIDNEATKAGLSNTKIPARLEVISLSPLIILDGAHNASGASVLSHFLISELKDKKLTLVIGMLKDKDVKEFAKTVVPLADKVVVTAPLNNRAMSIDNLGGICETYCDDVSKSYDITTMLRNLISNCKPNEAIIVCGSLYLCSDLRAPILKILNNMT